MKISKKYIDNRVTVSFVLLMTLIFIVIPVVVIIDLMTKSDMNNSLLSQLSLSIIIIYTSVIILWHVYSLYLKKKNKKYRSSTENDLVHEYENGFEVFADVNLFGYAKNIGYRKLKLLFAGNAIGLCTLLLILIIVGFINFDLLSSLIDNNLFLPICFVVYVGTVCVSLPVLNNHLE